MNDYGTPVLVEMGDEIIIEPRAPLFALELTLETLSCASKVYRRGSTHSSMKLHNLGISLRCRIYL